MKIIKSFGLFILLISPVILFHELGHLILGSLLGFNPHTFSIGFGPKLLSFNVFNINWVISSIPLGGYVEFPEFINLSKADQGKWFLVAIVGPFFNFIYAIGLLYGYLYFLLKQIKIMKVFSIDYTGNVVLNPKEDLVKITIESPNKFFSNKLFKEGIIFNKLNLEVFEGSFYESSLKTMLSSKEAFKLATFLTYNYFFGKPLKLLKDLLMKSSKSHDKSLNREGVLGPIGIAQIASWSKSHGWAHFTLMSINFSWSLGIFNLIPLAPLDGGQALRALLQMLGVDVVGDAYTIYQLVSIALVLVLLSWGLLSDVFSFRKK